MRQHISAASRDGVPAAPTFARPRGASTELQTAFEERVQQLSIRGKAGNALVTAHFDYELKNYNVLEADDVAKMLGSSVTAGLTAAAAADGLKANGPNTISPPRDWPLAAKFVFSMFDGFAPILWVASLLCFIAWQPLGGSNPSPYNLGLAVLLLVIIFLGGIFVFWQEFQTARILSDFKSMIPDVAVAIRDGVAVSVPSAALTVGDVVLLQTGMKIPADVRVASVASLRVDNSLLTGEAEPVRLHSDRTGPETTTLAAHNMAFMGATVAQGSGTGVVVAVGDKCQIGCIVKLASTPPKTSSLQRELNMFVVIIACFAVFFFTLCMIVWGASIQPRHPLFMPTSAALANGMGVLVAVVPEGLPLALAAGLTVIAKRLCDKHFVLLKQLVTVETLGSMSLLASDKTGTLTQNLMSVVNVVTSLTAETLGIAEAAARVAKSSAPIAALARCASLCNDASIQAPPPPPAQPVAASAITVSMSPTPAPVIVGGNGTDKALLAWAASLGQGAEARDAFVPVHSIPFSSVTKQAVSVQTGTSDGVSVVFVKGAPDALIPRCSHFASDGADPSPLTEDTRAAFDAALDALGRQGKRVLALCERVLPRAEFPPGFAFSSDPEPNFPLDGLTLLGLVAIADPPRPSTAPAVAELRIAGIRVAMVTGDAETTAEAIARQVGIITLPTVHRPGSTIWAAGKAPSAASAGDEAAAAAVVTGPELSRFTPSDWAWLLRHPEIVLARTTPEQKLAFVQAAQQAGHRVGVTGDGMNDAPALRNADIGVAMNSGSDAARDAAHVVLLKDDFAALVHAAREGRLIFANLRKVCAYLITGGCWSELLPVLANFFLGMPTPLSAFLMIVSHWVRYISCVTDVCAGIALIYESPEGAIMQGTPRDHRKSKLVDLQLVLSQYLFYGMMISFATFFNTLYYFSRRAGLDGPTMISSSTTDPSGTTLNYFPDDLLFAWGWASTPDQVQALNTASSIFFITIIVCQLGNYMSIRRRCSPYFSDFKMGATPVDFIRNLTVYLTPTIPIVCAFVLEIVFAIIIIETPGAQATFSTSHIPGENWGIAVGFSLAAFTISEAGKWWIHFHPTSVLRAIFWK